MKHHKFRVIIIVALLVQALAIPHNLQAQFEDYGVRGSIGLATISDDLSTKSPIFGAGIGGYINYTFASSQAAFSEVFYLQSGLNFNRRGSDFEVKLEQGNSLSVREGYYHAYYVQVPILACFRFELPIRKAGHVVGAYLGPAVNFGLFGRYKDRMVTPGLSDPATNYDSDIDGTASDRAVFNHLRRFDVSAVVGLSYSYGDFGVSLYLDHGFIATSTATDVLRQLDQTLNGTEVRIDIPNGNNTAWMLAVSYRLGSFAK